MTSIVEVLRIDPNNLFQVRSLLQDLSPEEKEQKINEPDELGDTALHVAASKGQLLVVKYLVQNGADFNIQNNAGSTPVHKAFLSGSKGVVDYLLLNEPEWITNYSGFTPFVFAREILRSDRELLQKLLTLEDSSHSETMVIPYSKLRFIVGKQKRMLDLIRVDYQTDVSVPPRPRDADSKEGDCEIKLTARTKEDVERAKQKIENIMRDQDEKKPTPEEEITDWGLAVETEEKKKLEKNSRRRVTEKDADPSLFSRNLYIPKEVKKIISEDKEEKIKELKKTGATIIMPQKEEYITIRGEPNEVDEAIRIINSLVKKHKGTADLPERKIHVAKNKHKFVMGKTGSNLRRLEETFKVEVIVPPSKSLDEFIVIRGELPSIENAKYDILETINYYESGPRNPGGGGGSARKGGPGRGSGRGRGGGDGENARGGGGGYSRRNDEESPEEKPISPRKQVPLKINLKDEEQWPVWPST